MIVAFILPSAAIKLVLLPAEILIMMLVHAVPREIILVHALAVQTGHNGSIRSIRCTF
jgi:hypothetical protein